MSDRRDLRALARHLRRIGDDARAYEARLIAEGAPPSDAWAAAWRYEEQWTRDLLERAERDGEQ